MNGHFTGQPDGLSVDVVIELLASPGAPSTTQAGAQGRGAGPVGLVLGGAISVQFGAAVAALLFPRAGVAGVVMLRLVIAAVLLTAVSRPRLRGYDRTDWLTVGGFGVALAGMNALIYEAIDRIPLGVAVTVEVLGPLVLSVVTGRRASRWLWAALALAGVTALGHGGIDGSLDLVGIAFAGAAAATWAGYILLSACVGKRFPKADGLALAMSVAAVLTLPWGVAVSGPALIDPVTIGLGAAVAVLSSVLPYTLEMLALRRMPTSTFAVLMSLGPAIAALAGYLVLSQALSLTPLLGIGLVIAASVGAATPPRAARSSA